MHMIKVALSHFCCMGTTLQCQMSRESAMDNRHLSVCMCSTAV